MRGGNVWIASSIVFLSGACVMALELIAGRMIAPYLGVSLYTWTSVIGVVLAGISLGNYLGGKIADRWASHATLGILLLLSGIFSIGVLLTMNVMTGSMLPLQLPLPARILALTTFIFFAPGCVLGTIPPVVVRLTLRNLAEMGDVVGRIYAFSALGSIVGTFFTGFVLIVAIGTRATILSVALALVAMALVFGDWGRAKRGSGVLLAAFIAFGYLVLTEGNLDPRFLAEGALRSRFLKETNYYSVLVNERPIGDGKVAKDLILDHLIHSSSVVEDPTHLGYPYEIIYADVARYLAQSRPKLRTMFVGGGGYTFPRYVEAVYPASSIDVAEIDPGVTEVAHERMGLRRDTRIRTFNEDARLFFIEGQADKKYDLVVGDAFNDLSIPYHLTTLEFDRLVKRALDPGGFYVVNVVDNFQRGEFLRAYVNTLKRAFGHVYLFGFGGALERDTRSTFVVVAGEQPLDLEGFERMAAYRGATFMPGEMMPPERLDQYLRSRPVVLLTDDYAPVDNLMAPRFVERGR